MKKKLLNLFLIICITIGISSSAYALPKDIIIIGDQAFEIGALFLPEYFDAINDALTDANGVLFYNLESTGDEFKSLFGDKPITEEDKTALNNVKLTKATGEVAFYETFDDDEPTILAMATSMETISNKKILVDGTLVLPTEIKVMLNDAATTEKIADVVWDESNFDNSKIGTYTISGKLSVKEADKAEYTISTTLNPSIQVIVEDSPSGTANVTVSVASIPTFKQITINTLTNGTKFTIDGVTGYHTIGETITTITSEKTLTITVFDGEEQLGSFELAVDTESTNDYNYKLGTSAEKTSNISIEIGSISSFKTIKVNSSTLGTQFKVDYSTKIEPIGSSILVNTGETTCKVYFLNSAEEVLATVTLDLSSETTKDYSID